MMQKIAFVHQNHIELYQIVNFRTFTSVVQKGMKINRSLGWISFKVSDAPITDRAA